jgi:multiple sugar transport system permease protein
MTASSQARAKPGAESGRVEIGAGRLAGLMTAPALVLVLAIVAYPLLFALVLAFHQVGVRELRSGEMPFVGIENFLALANDAVFLLSLQHTFVFVALSVALELLLGLGIALIINEQGVRISAVTRVLILLPWAVPPISPSL